jgi:hypothetical protein
VSTQGRVYYGLGLDSDGQSTGVLLRGGAFFTAHITIPSEREDDGQFHFRDFHLTLEPVNGAALRKGRQHLYFRTHGLEPLDAVTWQDDQGRPRVGRTDNEFNVAELTKLYNLVIAFKAEISAKKKPV